jgi:hypothetical protein
VLLGIAPGDFLGRHRRVPGQPEPRRAHDPGRPIRARPGRNDKGEDIVWIDYAASLAIHRLRPAPAQERRPARLASPTPDDNRISAGCVVVPVTFYDLVVAPTLGSGRGVVYVLPESRPVHSMFAALELSSSPTDGGETTAAAARRRLRRGPARRRARAASDNRRQSLVTPFERTARPHGPSFSISPRSSLEDLGRRLRKLDRVFSIEKIRAEGLVRTR